MEIWRKFTTNMPVFILVCVVASVILFQQVASAADCVRARVDFKKLKGVVERKEFLEKAILECVDDPEITYYYAYNMERLRKYDTALEYYRKAVSLDQNFAKAYMGMGDMYKELGEVGRAVAAYEKGLSLDPDNVWAKRSLQEIRSRSSQKAAVPLPEAKPVKTVQKVQPPQQKTIVAAEKVKQQADPGNGRLEKVAVTTKSTQQSDVGRDDFIKGMIREDAASDQLLPGKKVQSMHMPIQFEMDSGALTEEAMTLLDTVICQALQSDDLRGMRFEIVGHTDNTGTVEVNMYVSRLRAHTVKAYLETRCNVDPARLEVSYQGPSQPLFPNTTLENRTRNRRVEFRRLM
ncbi:MAG: OmpA family protein [Desulfobulbaceae bacterium]|uniref:OmpA family protein n=1 Tax=Candidatus Desulfobia pelagia TaxID=2841692 RepID=A0A8J6N9G3_9BACT|nr:OmpA family protein [Candidatus Desulfobia pelagia]